MLQSSSVQEVLGSGLSWGNISHMRPHLDEQTPPPQFAKSIASWHDNRGLPASWSHLLLGGIVDEEERYSLYTLQTKKMENLEHKLVDVKQESFEGSFCVTTSFSSNDRKAEKRDNQPDHSSECNSKASGSACKKARVQAASSSRSCFKVRKVKLGDRITALHQLVSPFGKTDTASVLLESICYIRFLQSQIEALSSPYLDTGSASRRQEHEMEEDEAKKDLRSRGLCLVPVSCMHHVDSEADGLASILGSGLPCSPATCCHNLAS